MLPKKPSELETVSECHSARRGTKNKILVIDDDPSIRNLLGALLPLKGYQVMLAKNGLEGLKLFRQEHPDVILLDLNMPGMGGLTVLQQVRLLNHDQPVIIFSGAWTPQTEEQVRALGVTEIVKKEFPHNQLEKALKRVLNGSDAVV